MSDMLTIFVPGEARGKGRPRFARRGAFVSTYTDEKTANYENWLKACAVNQVGSPCLEGALAVTMDIHVSIPQSWSAKKKNLALAGNLTPTGKPDVDNCIKVLDALNKIVWRDDSQIIDMVASKRYGAVPHTVITVQPL